MGVECPQSMLFAFCWVYGIYMAGSSQPQHFFAEGCIFADFAIAVIFYPVIKSLSYLCILFGCSSTQICNLRAKINFANKLKNVFKILRRALRAH